MAADEPAKRRDNPLAMVVPGRDTYLRTWTIAAMSDEEALHGYVAKCGDCEYPLDGLADGVCPECGGAFTHAGMRQAWIDQKRTPTSTAVTARVLELFGYGVLGAIVAGFTISISMQEHTAYAGLLLMAIPFLGLAMVFTRAEGWSGFLIAAVLEPVWIVRAGLKMIVNGVGLKLSGGGWSNYDWPTDLGIHPLSLNVTIAFGIATLSAGIGMLAALAWAARARRRARTGDDTWRDG